MATITLDWLHVIALLGAIQGFILARVLAARQQNRTANRVLAVAMLAFSVYLTMSVYFAAGLVQVFPHLFGLAYPIPLLYGPLVYLYAVTASDRARRITRRDALHFAPFALAIVATLPINLMSAADKLAFFAAIQSGDVPLVIRLLDPLKLVSGVTYTVITIVFLQRHRAHVRDNYSSLEHVNLQWLLRLAAAAAAIWGLAVVFEVTEFLPTPAFQRGDDVITLAIALLVYAIGYMALRQPEIFRFDTAEFPVAGPATPADSVTQPSATVDGVDTSGRYERSGLSDREAEALRGAVLTVMDQERPWQQSDLTLADLAQRLSTTPHKLSEVLNSRLRQPFYDFVNGYRVRHVQNRLGSEEAKHLTLLSLALEAGFASKSTFNDVFKKHTGQTPSSYRHSVSAE